jgi:hypothetical protein
VLVRNDVEERRVELTFADRSARIGTGSLKATASRFVRHWRPRCRPREGECGTRSMVRDEGVPGTAASCRMQMGIRRRVDWGCVGVRQRSHRGPLVVSSLSHLHLSKNASSSGLERRPISNVTL